MIDPQTLPSTWVIIRLSQVTKIIMGQAPEGSTYNDEEIGLPLIAGAGDLGEIYPQPSKWTTAPTQVCETGDLIYCIRATIGDMNWADREYCVGRGVAAIRANSNLLMPDFMYFWLSMIKDQVVRLGTGSTFLQIRRQDLESIEIPLPTLPEQRRIVEILRQADALRRLQTRYELAYKNMPRTLFDGFFGGPDIWKKTEPLATYVQFKGGGTPSRKLKHYFDGNIPWVTPKDMGKRFISDSTEHISEEALADSATQLVPANTLLIVVKSKILVHTLPLSIVTRSCAFNQDIKGLICRHGVDIRFIYGAIQAQVQLVLRQARGANTEGLTLDMLRQLRVPVVDKRTLNAFLDAIGIFDPLANKTVQRNRQMNSLAQSLFGKAFSGFLTKQWRSERISELSDFVISRDIILGLRAEEPTIGDYKGGRVTQAEREEIEQHLSDSLRPVLTQMAQYNPLGETLRAIEESQARWAQQLAQITLPIFIQMPTIEIAPLLSDAVSNALLGFQSRFAALADENRRAMESLTNHFASIAGISHSIGETFASSFQPITLQLTSVIESLARAIDEWPPTDHPHFNLISHLNRRQKLIHFACEQQAKSFTVETIQAEVGLSQESVRRVLDLLASLGLLAVVSVAAESADGPTFVTAYRSIAKSDDVRLADLALLQEPDQK